MLCWLLGFELFLEARRVGCPLAGRRDTVTERVEGPARHKDNAGHFWCFGLFGLARLGWSLPYGNFSGAHEEDEKMHRGRKRARRDAWHNLNTLLSCHPVPLLVSFV